MENKYDVIIIGSGIGGLAAGSILSKVYGKKVLLLERHFKIGGFTHIFKRKGSYVWDVGLHYVGEMQEGSQSSMMMNFITGGGVKWQKMPEVYDKAVFPDFTFEFREGKENLKSDLSSKFPHEKNAIEQYFADIEKSNKWLQKYQIFQTFPISIQKALKKIKYSGSELSLGTTREYLDKNFRDEKLKSLLAFQYGDHGLPPSESSFAIHAIITSHYFNGGYFPIGSSKVIADSIVPIIESKGGVACVNHEVTEIIVKNGKAVGVKVLESRGNEKIEKEFFADTIISNAGAEITYNKLLKEHRLGKIRNEIESQFKPVSNLTLYIGLKDDPEKLGFKGENHWIYNNIDIDKVHSNRNSIINGEISQAYLSFPSKKNAKAPGHTAEIITFVDYEPFQKWAALPWKNRGEDYNQLKEKLSELMLDFIESRYPGFKALVDYYELSTPLSTEHFTGNRKGNIYGMPATPARYKSNWIGYRTSVKNLYLAGTDSTSHGIVGAMMGGVISAAVSQGVPFSLMKIFKAAAKYSKAQKNIPVE